MKVRHKDGRVGAVECVFGNRCSVQFGRDEYYKLCDIDDLTPIEDEEFYGNKVR